MSLAPRIAFVSPLAFGGSTTFLCNLAGALVRRNVPVAVVSPEKQNPFATDFQTAAVQVCLHDDRRMIFEDRMTAMLQTLAAFQPTIVVSCLGPATYEVLRYVPRGVYRMAVIQADAKMFYDGVNPYAGCLDGVVGVSRKIVEQLGAMPAFNTVTKHHLHCGVTMPETFAPRRTTTRPLRILYLGRIINAQKRVHLFPSMLAVLQKAGIAFQWTIAGEGDQRANLERLMVSKHPEQQVLFPGPLPNVQVPALLDKHDVFLLASDAEGLPVSLLEAMGHGLVPVISDLESGVREVVDAGNGMLVPVDDVAGYARAIIHLHEHREELAAKSVAAHDRVKRDFSVEAMADRWLAAFPKNCPAVQWPVRWKIQPMLAARHPFYFSPPMRVLRRLAMKFRT